MSSYLVCQWLKPSFPFSCCCQLVVAPKQPISEIASGAMTQDLAGNVPMRRNEYTMLAEVETSVPPNWSDPWAAHGAYHPSQEETFTMLDYEHDNPDGEAPPNPIDPEDLECVTDFYYPKLYGRRAYEGNPKVVRMISMQSTFEDLGLHSTPQNWDPERHSQGIMITAKYFSVDPRDSVREDDLYRLLGASHTDSGAVLKQKARLANLEYHPDKARNRIEGEITPEMSKLIDQRLSWITQAREVLLNPKKRKFWDWHIRRQLGRQQIIKDSFKRFREAEERGRSRSRGTFKTNRKLETS